MIIKCRNSDASIAKVKAARVLQKSPVITAKMLVRLNSSANFAIARKSFSEVRDNNVSQVRRDGYAPQSTPTAARFAVARKIAVDRVGGGV
jgi:hypothetical protein